TEDDFELIAEKADAAIEKIDHSDGLQLGVVNGIVASITTLELLEKYHEWLQE
ncbi:hypothetical protein HO409_09220, partial [Streptococcus suis]|nr:hypothetical protein [Streptococcus suis]NQM39050.1 hypothetical protein [Streptococcus suis]